MSLQNDYDSNMWHDSDEEDDAEGEGSGHHSDLAYTFNNRLKIKTSVDNMLDEDTRHVDMDIDFISANSWTSAADIIDPWSSQMIAPMMNESGSGAPDAWANFGSDNFADFDSHFGDFQSAGTDQKTTSPVDAAHETTDINVNKAFFDKNENITLFSDRISSNPEDLFAAAEPITIVAAVQAQSTMESLPMEEGNTGSIDMDVNTANLDTDSTLEMTTDSNE